MFTWSPVRRKRAALVAAGLGLVLAALWVARNALFPYLIALLIAYLMLPVVGRVERLLQRFTLNERVARPLAIFVVYLLAAGLVALFVAMVVPVLTQQFNALWSNRVQLASRLQELTNQSLQWYRQNVPEVIQAQVQSGIQRASGTVASAVQSGLTATLGFVTSTVSFILGMAVIPFWLFYVLYDRVRVRQAVKGVVPASWWPDFRNLLLIVDKMMGAYIRGQLLLSLSIGLMAALGLTILGVQFTAILALLAAMFEFLPFIGPILGAVPAVIVATIQQPILGLWTALLFLGIQQIENVLLAPRISGEAVELHPAVIMVVLVVGNEVAGLWGMLVAVPLTAILRDTFRYLYLRLLEKPVKPGRGNWREFTGEEPVGGNPQSQTVEAGGWRVPPRGGCGDTQVVAGARRFMRADHSCLPGYSCSMSGRIPM